MPPLSRLLLAAACALGLAAPAEARHASSAEAAALLASAVAEIQAAGPARAFAEFDRPHGRFVQGELYVFVLSPKGRYEAYGANPALVGSDVSDLADAEGKPIVREMIAPASKGGHGKLDYVWRNPGDNRVEHKVSLVERVGDHVVGVGYYPG